jgi:hypothetical protein
VQRAVQAIGNNLEVSSLGQAFEMFVSQYPGEYSIFSTRQAKPSQIRLFASLFNGKSFHPWRRVYLISPNTKPRDNHRTTRSMRRSKNESMPKM